MLFQGRSGHAKRAAMGVPDAMEIVDRPQGIQVLTRLDHRGAVDRTFAWMFRYRRLSQDVARSLESTLAWAPRAAS
ncbi:MAG: hypothetical protein OXD33_12945 [Rhodobacteraceae bacterium]|nr:hypothetical protein [Paracoccaceae bacterium]